MSFWWLLFILCSELVQDARSCVCSVTVLENNYSPFSSLWRDNKWQDDKEIYRKKTAEKPSYMIDIAYKKKWLWLNRNIQIRSSHLLWTSYRPVVSLRTWHFKRINVRVSDSTWRQHTAFLTTWSCCLLVLMQSPCWRRRKEISLIILSGDWPTVLNHCCHRSCLLLTEGHFLFSMMKEKLNNRVKLCKFAAVEESQQGQGWVGTFETFD